MDTPDTSRRELLIQGSAGLVLLQASWLVQAFPSRPGEEVVPWLDQPGANPSGGVVENLQPWENLGSFITPNDKFFRVRTTTSRSLTKRSGISRSPAWLGSRCADAC